jgi:DNA polymerase
MKLVVADSSQIEARVLPWVAGQADLLDVFRRNDQTKGDFYSDAGSAFFQKKLSKKETPTERQASKSMLLGLGYQMGWKKFAMVLLNQGIAFKEKDAVAFGVDLQKFLGSKKMEAVKELPTRLAFEAMAVHCAVVEFLVNRYRSTYAAIEGFWGTCEDVIAVMAPDEPRDGVRATFGPGECIKIRRHALELPNGMLLRYPGLRESEEGGYSYIGDGYGKTRTHLYGGKLTENIVQALARIIVMEQMLLIRAKFEKDFGCRFVQHVPAMRSYPVRHPIVTTTHDEVVAGVKDEHADAALAFALATMRRPPAWAPDLPLNASGDFAQSYGEAK